MRVDSEKGRGTTVIVLLPAGSVVMPVGATRPAVAGKGASEAS